LGPPPVSRRHIDRQKRIKQKDNIQKKGKDLEIQKDRRQTDKLRYKQTDKKQIDIERKRERERQIGRLTGLIHHLPNVVLMKL